jgi:hypothetical protein
MLVGSEEISPGHSSINIYLLVSVLDANSCGCVSTSQKIMDTIGHLKKKESTTQSHGLFIIGHYSCGPRIRWMSFCFFYLAAQFVFCNLPGLRNRGLWCSPRLRIVFRPRSSGLLISAKLSAKLAFGQKRALKKSLHPMTSFLFVTCFVRNFPCFRLCAFPLEASRHTQGPAQAAAQAVLRFLFGGKILAGFIGLRSEPRDLHHLPRLGSLSAHPSHKIRTCRSFPAAAFFIQGLLWSGDFPRHYSLPEQPTPGAPSRNSNICLRWASRAIKTSTRQVSSLIFFIKKFLIQSYHHSQLLWASRFRVLHRKCPVSPTFTHVLHNLYISASTIGDIFKY